MEPTWVRSLSRQTGPCRRPERLSRFAIYTAFRTETVFSTNRAFWVFARIFCPKPARSTNYTRKECREAPDSRPERMSKFKMNYRQDPRGPGSPHEWIAAFKHRLG